MGDGEADTEFLSHYLAHPNVQEWIVNNAVGTTMLNLNTSIIRSLPVSLPPIPEQKAIAHILGTLDDKIELNRLMNAPLGDHSITTSGWGYPPHKVTVILIDSFFPGEYPKDDSHLPRI
jgi:hypothetical protein